MNLFRSEEHARRWVGYNEAMDDAVKPLAEWADIFSNQFFRQRTRPDYISWAGTEDGMAAFTELRSKLPRATES